MTLARPSTLLLALLALGGLFGAGLIAASALRDEASYFYTRSHWALDLGFKGTSASVGRFLDQTLHRERQISLPVLGCRLHRKYP